MVEGSQKNGEEQDPEGKTLLPQGRLGQISSRS